MSRPRILALLLALSLLWMHESPAQSPFDCSGVPETAQSALEGVLVIDRGFTGTALYLTQPPGDTSRLFLVTKEGRIYVKPKGGPIAGPHQLYLDISSKVRINNEGGLLGLAFPPDFETTKHFFVYYTDRVGLQTRSVVSRFTEAGGVANPASELVLLRFNQPEDNHNGGQVLFDDDGYLLIFTGDGGGGGDIHGACGNGQDATQLLGKVLRLDVLGIDPDSVAPDCGPGPGGSGYRVPSSNPFTAAGDPRCAEVVAWGLRNPWRNDQDPLTGELYLADVGQNCWEEVNVTPKASFLQGVNYGWRKMEGRHCYSNATPSCTPAPDPNECSQYPTCNDAELVLPVFEYSHGVGCSITGGHVYRGCRMPNLRGRYFYGDYCEGFVRSILASEQPGTAPLDHTDEVDPDGLLIGGLFSFGRDAQGELYVLGSRFAMKILPPFANMAVSAPGVGEDQLFSLGDTWSWEDFALATDHPVAFYRVYRSASPSSEVFRCVHRTADATPQWVGGDPTEPPTGTALFYLVTAVNPSGAETSSGHPAVTVIPGLCP